MAGAPTPTSASPRAWSTWSASGPRRSPSPTSEPPARRAQREAVVGAGPAPRVGRARRRRWRPGRRISWSMVLPSRVVRLTAVLLLSLSVPVTPAHGLDDSLPTLSPTPQSVLRTSADVPLADVVGLVAEEG